jgi:hypothetical protein
MVDNISDKIHKMVFRKPITKTRRQQQQLIWTVTRIIHENG